MYLALSFKGSLSIDHTNEQCRSSWIPSVYKITINQSTNQSKSLSTLGIGRSERGGQVRVVGVEGDFPPSFQCLDVGFCVSRLVHET